MKADGHALQALAALAGHDVRTCLNTLQFVSAKNGSLSEETLDSAGVGRKSVGKSALQVRRLGASPRNPPGRARALFTAPVDSDLTYHAK